MDVDGTPVGRRLVLAMVGLGALGVVAGRPLANAISALARHVPSGVAGVIPGGGFRFYTVTDEPQVAPADYHLQVTGLVDRPGVFGLAALEALPQTHLVRDFQCVTGWRVPGVPWSGVKLADLLDHVGVTPDATAVNFTSFDGVYTESLTLDEARRSDVLVATRMLGAPVTRAHGGPVRLYVAPMYGYKSLKWLGGIEVTSHIAAGYWELRGYDTDAWVGSSNGRSDAPT
jgi:DMSO/TMAO reductase YedYZ molybdopterin-dependent catalytic subunit